MSEPTNTCMPTSSAASSEQILDRNLNLQAIDSQQEKQDSNFVCSGLPLHQETFGECCTNSCESESSKTMEASGDSGMETFLQKMKSDLMFELRKIQHGERPVTGQNNRENIQKFMEKHVVPDGSAEASGSPADIEAHRPEAVVVEVQGVIEQRRVSSVLQSAAFRRQLENVIRGSIQSTRRQATPVPRPRASRNVATHSTQNSPRIQARAVQPEPAPTFVVPEPPALPAELRLPQRERSDSVSSIDSFSSARSSADIDDLNDLEEEAAAAADIRPPTPHASPSLPVPSRQNNTDTGMENLTWGDISRVHREELVEEISDLLHSRLVSSTLDGEFRATLELLVQDRVAASGTNGRQVENVIRSLPRGGVVRNDFTHLGIVDGDMDNLDNISVTSVSAHSIPYTQTSAHLSREIQSLKAQMREMKNMIKLNFDLQLDIQRAIRQEVAAAMQSVAAAGGASASPQRPASQPINDTHCLICLDKHSDSVLYQCGHMCVCYICGKDLISRNLGCPVCRAPIKDIIRAYKTNSE